MLKIQDGKYRLLGIETLQRCLDGHGLAAWLAVEFRRLDSEAKGILAICPEETRDWEFWHLPTMERENWAAGDSLVAEIRAQTASGTGPIPTTLADGQRRAYPLRDDHDQFLGALVMEPVAGGARGDLDDWLCQIGALAGLALERIRRGRRLAELEQEVSELESLKNDFMDTVSHELKTPLTSILGFSLLAKGLPGIEELPPLPEFLNSIHDNADKLDRLIGEILMMSNMASAEGMLEIAECSLDELLQEFREQMLPRLEGHERVRWSEHPEGHDMRVDPYQFLRILEHLVVNALDFSDETEPVHLNFRLLTGRRRGDETDYLRVDVVDRGVGVAPEEQERIFRKFYQVDGSSTRSRGGVGIGLAVAGEFATAMGGRLWLAESVPGEGSTFSFTVPVLRPRESD